MPRTPSGNARNAPVHLRVTTPFKRYLGQVCEEESCSESALVRNALGLLLELRRDYREVAAARDVPLVTFVKMAVKDHVERTTP